MIAECHRSTDIGPDVVANDDVARRREAREETASDRDTEEAVPGDHVAGAGAQAADGVTGRSIDDDAVVRRVSQRDVSSPVRPDEVPFDRVAGRRRTGDVDAMRVARDHVPVGRSRAADDVVRRVDREDTHPEIAQCGRAVRIGTEKVAGDEISAGVQKNAAPREPIDHEAPHRAAREDIEPVGVRVRDLASIELDHGYAREAGLRRAIDRDRIGDRGQGREELDRSCAAAGNVEADQVRTGARVRVEDRLTQAAGSVVVGVDDKEGRRPRWLRQQKREARRQTGEVAFSARDGRV